MTRVRPAATKRRRIDARAILLTLVGATALEHCAKADPPALLPDAPGRELVEHKCAQCHSLETVVRSHRTRKQWEAQLDAMLGRGAKLSDEEFEQVADYLAGQLGLPPP